MLRIPKRASLGSLGKQTSKLIIILNAEHVLEWTWEDQDTVLKTHSFRRLGGSVSCTFAFSSGLDPMVLGSSPTSGSLLSGEPASPSPSAAPSVCALSLSNK